MNDQTNRKFGAVISMLNMVVSLVVGLVYTPIALRLLGQSEYGVYSLALSFIAYLTMLDMGFGNALVRYSAKAREKEEKQGIYGMFLLFYVGIALIAAVIGTFLVLNVESFFDQTFTQYERDVLGKTVLILLVNTVIAFPGSVFSSVIRANQKFIFANSMNLVMNVLRHAINLVVLFLGFKSVALAFVSLGITVLTILINMLFCFGKLKIRFGFKRFEGGFYREVFVYSFFILINIVVDQLYAGTDKVILGKVCSSVAVSVYTVGVTFQTYFTEFSTSISGVFLPHISQLSTQKDGIRKMSDLFIKVGRIQFTLLAFILCGFAVYGTEFVPLWAGEGYESAYFIALLVMIPNMIPLSQNIGISVLQALNKHRYRSVMYLCIAVFKVLISIPLSMRWEGIGAATASVIATCAGQIVFMNIVYSKMIGLDIKGYWKQSGLIVLKMLPIAGIFLGAKLLLPPALGWGMLLTKIGLGVAFSAPYAFFLLLTEGERSKLLKKLHLVKA